MELMRKPFVKVWVFMCECEREGEGEGGDDVLYIQ